MYSLNAPVPGEVKRLAAELHPDLYEFDSIRERHTLLVKRLGTLPLSEYARTEQRVRRALSGAPACEARIAGIDLFERPVRGDGPVVYLAVESPGLVGIHERVVEELGAVPDLEGEAYVPHVTLARGGSTERARELAARRIEPITWTIDELRFYDARHDERVSSLSLP